MDKAQEKIADYLKIHEKQIVNIAPHDEEEAMRRRKVRFETAKDILDLIEALGYRKLPEGKPRLLSPKELAKVWLEEEQSKGFCRNVTLREVLNSPGWFNEVEEGHAKATAQAQRDIDVEHYGGEK